MLFTDTLKHQELYPVDFIACSKSIRTSVLIQTLIASIKTTMLQQNIYHRSTNIVELFVCIRYMLHQKRWEEIFLRV